MKACPPPQPLQVPLTASPAPSPPTALPPDICLRLARHVDANNNADLAGFQPLWIAGRRLGSLSPRVAEMLEAAGRLARIARPATGWSLRGDPATPAAITAALDGIAEALVAARVLPRLKGERYAVAALWGAERLGSCDRAAVPVLGLPAYGIHINGFTRLGPAPQDLRLWIGQRAADREVAPGKLDTMVGGGQPAELTLAENVVKEAAEEAGLTAERVRHARPTGAVTYTRHDSFGLRVDTLYSFDLELAPGEQPHPQDDEVACFHFYSAADVLEILAAGDSFKNNCALMVIDFLIRHGVLTPDMPGYAALCRGMHGRHPHDPPTRMGL